MSIRAVSKTITDSGALGLRDNMSIEGRMNDELEIDWTACDLVERVRGKMGGRPVIKGTRIEPETVLIDEEYGWTPEQTHVSFPTLPLDTILKIRAFAHKHQLTP